ncbi:hypothetical protein LCGC14_1106030 [marine sediment metagenome]|uniref:Uncharacterized protein n=1 Tax=marine sediment metagenome TaxID=412755 RepID=A0A0F9M841_9ZZZZ
MSTTDIVIFLLAVACVVALAWATDRRLDSLEARMTTYETIRIEAPVTADGGRR